MASPVANFTFPEPSAAPTTLLLTDTSTGAPTSWRWTLNFKGIDYGSATTRDTSFYLPDAGDYTVTLTVSNAFGSSTTSRKLSVGGTPPFNPPPAVAFDMVPNGGTAPLTVQFINRTKYAYSYLWNFGSEAAISNLENPSFTFTKGGIYTVRLDAFGHGGNSHFSKQIVISASVQNDLPPVSGFATNVNSGAFPFKVQCVDMSFNSPTAWTWLCSTGETSNLQNPIFAINQAGTIKISLLAANGYGFGNVASKTVQSI